MYVEITVRYLEREKKLVDLQCTGIMYGSVAEPHHFYAAPALGKNFDAAPAPTLLYSKAKFLK
jgi:hypothetical protein